MKEKKLIHQWIKKVEFLNRPDETLYKHSSTDILYTKWMSQYVLKYIHFKFHEKVLCIGCHGGKWVSDIDKQVNIKGFILDQSIRLLQHAMHLYPHFNYDISNYQLSYKNRKFHKVIINQPFESFYEQQLLLTELERVLKKKGRIILFQRKSFILSKQNLSQSIEHTHLEIIQSTAYKNMVVYELKHNIKQ